MLKEHVRPTIKSSVPWSNFAFYRKKWFGLIWSIFQSSFIVQTRTAKGSQKMNCFVTKIRKPTCFLHLQVWFLAAWSSSRSHIKELHPFLRVEQAKVFLGLKVVLQNCISRRFKRPLNKPSIKFIGLIRNVEVREARTRNMSPSGSLQHQIQLFNVNWKFLPVEHGFSCVISNVDDSIDQ